MDFILEQFFALLPIFVPLLWILRLASKRRKKAATDKGNPKTRVIKSKKDAVPPTRLMDRLAAQFAAGKNYIATEPDVSGRLEEAGRDLVDVSDDAPDDKPYATAPGLKAVSEAEAPVQSDSRAVSERIDGESDKDMVSPTVAAKFSASAGGADALTLRLEGLSGPAQGMVWSVVLGRPLGL